ncbi:hypothetical protein NRIC0776_03960 [Apilactobacillus kunkeei]
MAIIIDFSGIYIDRKNFNSSSYTPNVCFFLCEKFWIKISQRLLYKIK